MPDTALRTAFDTLSAQVLIVDLSALTRALQAARTAGVVNLAEHLRHHPSTAAELVRQVRLVDANRAAWLAAGCTGVDDLCRATSLRSRPPYDVVFSSVVVAAWEGRHHIEDEISFTDTDGSRRVVLLQSNVATRHDAPDWSQVVISLTQITSVSSVVEADLEDQEMQDDIFARANLLLWRARVWREGGVLRWKVKFPSPTLTSRLLHLVPDVGGGWLWNPERVPDLAEMNVRSTAAINSGAPGYQQEFRVVMDDRTTWLSEDVAIQQSAPNEWTLVGVVSDVTARREAEEHHRRSDAHLRNILERADCMLWLARVVEVDGTYRWDLEVPASSFQRKIFGERGAFTYSNITGGGGKTLYGTFHIPELDQKDAVGVSALRRGASGYKNEFRLVTPEQTYWLQELVTIRKVEPGVFDIVGVTFDITARREAEEELAGEKERLAVTLRAMSESVITTDTRGFVQFINRGAGHLTDCDPGFVIGRPLSDICVLVDATSGAPHNVPLAAAIHEGVMFDLPPNTLLRRPGGENRLVAGRCVPVRDAGSALVGAVLVMADITERHHLEENLQRASKLESIGILAGGIAHDFNNILTAILGNISLALVDALPESPYHQSLDEARRACLRARDLTQQLLTFAKGGDPVRSIVHLAAVITEVARFALRGSNIGCEFDLPEDLWSANADRGQCGQIVQNLVINAVQASGESGMLHIAARNVVVTGTHPVPVSPGDYVHISVADRGSGIRPEDITRIFDPYFTTKEQGHGLGLATVHSIVRRHGGHIEVESERGHGTTFQIWLPAVRTAHASTPPPPAERPGSFTGRVLFMDDEASIRKLGTTLLNRCGLEVEVAQDGAEAVALYEAAHAAGRPFDVVVMDLTVPGGMGGREALEHLLRFDPNTRAIVSSGYSSDPVLANFRDHGFCGMVAKPYQFDQFAKVLRDVLVARE